MIVLNPVFFLRGNHYLLESLYYLRQYDKFKTALKKFEVVTQEKWFPLNDNNESLTFLFIYNNKFNLHFIEGSFDEGLPLIDDVLEQLKNYKNRVDEHHIMVF